MCGIWLSFGGFTLIFLELFFVWIFNVKSEAACHSLCMGNIMLFDVLSYCVMFMCSDSLWTAAHCRQWEGILRGVERILKDAHFLVLKWQHFTNIHTGIQRLQNKRIFDWKSCMTEPKVCDITLCYVNTSRILLSIRALQKLPTIWCKERQTSGAL